MAENAGRFAWVVRLAKIWAILALALLALALIAATTYVVFSIIQERSPWPVLAWFFLALGLAVAALWVGMAFGAISTLVSLEHNTGAVVDRLQRLESLTEALHESDDRLVDLARMSDAAKSLLFRQREIEAMNELLHEYCIRQDYAKAEALVVDIEKRFGYAEQVQTMRKDIASARSSTLDQKIDAALERVSRLIEAHDWDQAGRQADRLLQMLPNNPKVAALPQLIKDARVKHKRDLLEAYGEAVKAGDIDRSIALIKELDKYLAPQEAAALQDSARGVFKAKLHNLGVQFAIRVTEQNWAEAIAIGEQIVREYPNSGMAGEVRQKMDTLRALAAGKRPGP